MSLYLGDKPIANDGLQRLTGELGDIGIAPLGIDESLNLRRYLNGQVISQTQFEAFTTKVKSAVALFPSLATTESNWQSEKALSKFGQVGKFVIDDENQTIRLPAVVNAQGLLGLTGIGSLVNESLPNHTHPVEYYTTTTPGGSYQIPAPIGFTGLSPSGTDNSLGANNNTYQDNAPVQQEAIQYPYYIQVATGIEEELPAIREYKINTPFFFGQAAYFENDPYNASWLWSNGQYNASNLYPDLWVQLTGVELNDSLVKGDTIEINGKTYVKRGLPVKLSTDTYDDYDFVVNMDGQTFRLPLKTKLASGSAVVGNGMTLGFTDGSANFGLQTNLSGTSLIGDAGSYGKTLPSGDGASTDIAGAKCVGITTDPEKSGIETSSAGLRLYFYVGDVVQDSSLINAGAVLSDVVDLKQTTLRTDQITNCITEIPQDIKLELNDGALTLKAGSKVYIPNGFEEDGTTPKFDTYIVPSDLTKTANHNDSRMYYLTEGKTIDRIPFSMIYSGGSAPTNFGQWALWYDTTNNIVKYTANSGSTWVSGFSFPFCSATSDTTSIVSIDQVFNGFGYIGSTVFALPGVKGLIPNGRNADGSLRNLEFTISTVLTNTQTNTAGKTWGLYFNADGSHNGFSLGIYKRSIRTLSDRPTNWTSGCFTYVEDENKNYINQYTNFSLVILVADIIIGSSSITSFTPKLPFHAVDRNDSSWLSGLGMPSNRYINLTLLASGSTYTAPANGWFSAYCATGSSTSCFLLNNTNGINAAGTVIGGLTDGRCCIPVNKGDIIVFYYNGINANKGAFLRFIYAEGENV